MPIDFKGRGSQSARRSRRVVGWTNVWVWCISQGGLRISSKTTRWWLGRELNLGRQPFQGCILWA